MDGFAGFSSFLKLGCACPVPGVLARMPTESRSLTTHHHAPSASVKCWVSFCFCEPFCKRACCGHAGPKPKRNEIMQAGFWKGSVIMQSSDIYIYIHFAVQKCDWFIYICNYMYMIFSDVLCYSNSTPLTGVYIARWTKVYNASCIILDPWLGMPQGMPISALK